MASTYYGIALTSCWGTVTCLSLSPYATILFFSVTAAAVFFLFSPGNLNTSYWQYHGEPCDWRVCHFTGNTSLIVGISSLPWCYKPTDEALRYHLFLKASLFSGIFSENIFFTELQRYIFVYLLVEILRYYYNVFLMNSNCKTKDKEM